MWASTKETDVEPQHQVHMRAVEALLGKRVRYVLSGYADTNEIITRDDGELDRRRSPWSCTVEGEVVGWEISGKAYVIIAGYGGPVPAEKCEVI